MSISSSLLPQRWFASLLQALNQGQPQVLVSIVHARGSVPRDTGARMWVNLDHVVDTIGGGNLEWQAVQRARQWLQLGGSLAQMDITCPDRARGREALCVSGRREVVRFPLGPRLGQCCGGAVWLMFEWLDQRDIVWCHDLVQAMQQNRAVSRRLDFSSGAVCVDIDVVGPGSRPDADASTGHGALPDLSLPGQPLVDHFYQPEPVVVVCGAGHVGQAIVRLLADLPFQVVWLDPRPEAFPADLPANVRCLAGDADDVIDLPDDAFWLILTHNHALDLELIEAVLRYRTTRFLGMIGSDTKLARFRSRLGRHFSAQHIERLQCPIGHLPNRSKLPAAIAVSVVAQLMLVAMP
jgi:xanthine dehydrogenase accessory factor